MNSSIFWDITPCSLLKVNRHFEVKYCLQPTYTIYLLPSSVLCPPHTRTTFISVLPSFWLALFRPSHSPLDFYWFTIVLWKSQWELTGWIPWSHLLLHNPTFSQATCFVCCIIHVGFLFFNLEDGSDIFLRNICWLPAGLSLFVVPFVNHNSNTSIVI
jgi:hypothetical protein